MGKNRIEMRRQAEAAEALEKDKAVKPEKKKSTRAKVAKEPKAEKEGKKKAVRRTREKPEVRKRAIWVIYSNSMKEEGRYPYNQKTAAEERLEQLRAKSKRLYWMQMVKELITNDGGPVTVVPQLEEDPVAMDLDALPGVPGEEEEIIDLAVDPAAFEDGDEDEEEEEEPADAGDEE
jgi:hypothetical protein